MKKKFPQRSQEGSTPFSRVDLGSECLGQGAKPLLHLAGQNLVTEPATPGNCPFHLIRHKVRTHPVFINSTPVGFPESLPLVKLGRIVGIFHKKLLFQKVMKRHRHYAKWNYHIAI